MSSITELKKELQFVTEHLRIAKENLEYLKGEHIAAIKEISACKEDFRNLYKCYSSHKTFSDSIRYHDNGYPRGGHLIPNNWTACNFEVSEEGNQYYGLD